MLNRISWLVVATAFGALGAAAVIAPFVRSQGTAAESGGPVADVISAASAAQPDDAIARGRYVVAIAGCNDCHTPGFAANGGTTPESLWLQGDALGWQGPWGTTYPPNLRLYFAAIGEDAWLASARKREFLPPMPTPSLRAMTDDDLRAVYRYARSMGAAGVPAPAHLPPGRRAEGPVIVFPAPPK